MKKVMRINQDGCFIEDVLIQDWEDTPSDCIDVLCPDGFYLPKWNSTNWIEGGVVPAPLPHEPALSDRLYVLEEMFISLLI